MSLVQTSSVGFTFGNFDFFCNQVALPLCPLVGRGIEPTCYGRNIEFSTGGFLLFEPATLIIHFIALVMTAIMIYNIKSKYTAVGRKEIVVFFYFYAAVTLLEFFLYSGIIPISWPGYPYFVAVDVGLTVATLWCLLFNGFVGFQWIDDGTPLSLWSLRLSSAFVFLLSFAVGILTFQNKEPFSNTTPTGLFIVFFIFPAAFLVIYTGLQIVLVLNRLDDRWPLGDLCFGLVFFAIGQIFSYVFSLVVCNASSHYVDGLFFGTIFSLLGVMMVYKYWDSITKEDLEFAVGGRANVWEVKDPLLSADGGDIGY